jgi:hypothetical protein
VVLEERGATSRQVRLTGHSESLRQDIGQRGKLRTSPQSLKALIFPDFPVFLCAIFIDFGVLASTVKAIVPVFSWA